jgi:MGT family glycosyltransferase
MSKVLFLSVPAHGNINPTLGLVSELVKQGEEVTYFASDEFKDTIETTGAIYKAYIEDMDMFKSNKDNDKDRPRPMQRIMQSAHKIIEDILEQTKSEQFGYMIHSAAFPFAKVMKRILDVPTVSSLAIYAGLRDFLEKSEEKIAFFPEQMREVYKQASKELFDIYGVQLPPYILQMIYNEGDINLVYTSKYFVPDSDFFNDSYKFVGPPIYDKKENLDFPFEQLKGKTVIYISLGTVFSNFNDNLYQVFFDSFADMNAVIVLAAYNVDTTKFHVPDNFIIRNYVPQSALLKYTSAAVTHGGMNSMSDLISDNVPFVCIPLGADQPELAKRAEELGATISLDVNTLDAHKLRSAVEEVMTNPEYLENIKKIGDSFREAGGYKKAVEEIFKLKREKGITNES